jgi:hypothetical protein
MKKITTILTILACTISLHASDSLRLVGFNLYYSNSGSGYGYSTNMSVSIEKERRSLEIGMIFQPVSSKISGGEILYKHYFTEAAGNGLHGNGRIRAFVQYNFVFRHAQMHDRKILLQSGISEEIKGGRIATYEHYLGLGLQRSIVSNLNINAAIGYGISLGSVDEKYLDQPHFTEGGRRSFTSPVIKFGFGYSILK